MVSQKQHGDLTECYSMSTYSQCGLDERKTVPCSFVDLK